VLGVWGALLSGTLVVVWRRPLPLQLKIITARIVAQAGILSGAAAFGLVAYLTHTGSNDAAARAKVASSSWKLRDYSVPDVAAAAVAAAAAAPAAPVAAAPAELK
jgi:hypothetical protein